VKRKHKKQEQRKQTVTFFQGKGFLIYVVLAISLIFAILRFDPKLHTGGDNAQYILLGESLITGNGYKVISSPLNPPYSLYPPGYPLLVGGLMAVFGSNFLALKILSLLLSLGAIYVFYLIHKGEKQQLLPYLAVFLFGINPVFLRNSHVILSEPAFLFFSILTLYLFNKWESKNTYRLFIFATLSATFCYFLRTAGIAILLAVTVHLLCERKFKHVLVFVLVAMVFILPWNIRNAMVGDRSYTAVFFQKDMYDIGAGYASITDLIQRVGQNLKLYALTIAPKLVFPSYTHKPAYFILPFLTLGITIFAFIREILRKRRITHFYLFFYMGLVLVWPPVWSCDRYLLPILPFLLLYFFKGTSRITRNHVIVSIGLGVVCTLATLHEISPEISSNLSMLSRYRKGDKMAGYSPAWRNYYRVADWMTKHTPENSVVISRKRNLFYLHSDRKGMGYLFTHKTEDVFNDIIEKKADYIVVDRFRWTSTTPKYLIPALQAHPEAFKIVYATGEPKTFVLKVIQ
jgi:4-amino-4-deoxy-L-arabinose transferase-like glycosyltransferase